MKSVCDWAIDKQENYTLRPYLAATLLKHFHQPLLVQEALQVFLDRYDIKEGLLYEDYQRIYLLFGELGQSGVFSYHEFLQRLISRGDLEELDWIDEKVRLWSNPREGQE